VGRLGHHECDQHDGEQRDWSAQLSPSAQISQTFTGLTPNTSYTFSIAHRKSGGSPTGRIGVSCIAGATFTTINPGNSFASASVTFTGPAETSATLHLLSLNSTTYYDDAVLRAN